MTTRLSLTQIYSQGVRGMNDAQLALNKTQNQLSSNKKISTAAEDPIAAAKIMQLNETQNVLDRQAKAIDSAQSSLEVEDSTLTSVNDLLTRVRTLAVQANNGTLTQSDRKSIGSELTARLDELQSLANTKNSSGEYIFSGYKGQQQTIVSSGAGYVYQGDEGQRQAQVASSTYVATGDTGKAIFMDIDSDYLPAAAASTNTGSATISSGSVFDETAYAGFSGTYSINFTSTTTYDIVDSGGATVSAGTYTSGEQIQFNGVQLRITGTPAAGDSFSVSPASTQDMFTTIKKLADGLNSLSDSSDDQLRLQDLIAESIDNLDSAQNNVGTIQARVGARLNTLESAKSANESLGVLNQEVLSSIQDTDYTQATTDLSQQKVVLEAAQKGFAQISGLTLFDYL